MCVPFIVVACASIAPRETPPATDRYADVAEALSAFIKHEMDDKQLPGLSIALVDGDQVAWSAGFGMADPDKKIAATPETVYRIGSVSKLFTDIAVMQQAEKGALQLDAPITTYLPQFTPRNSFKGSITLRELMTHRSGLVREPPVGHYFDPTGPSLATTVASIDDTTLVYAPGSRTKYSNAGIATVGYVLEATLHEPFAKVLRQQVLLPLGMTHSSFEPEGYSGTLAKGEMVTVEGRKFPAPTFELGIAPAGSMYSTVGDLARFIVALLQDGTPILKPESRNEMFRVQYSKPGTEEGFGLGFMSARIDGRRVIGHSGAIYGFASTLWLLPDSKLGVAVATTQDAANGVTRRIAQYAFQLMTASRAHEALPSPEYSAAIAPDKARALDGRYEHGKDRIELIERAGQLFLFSADVGYLRLRALGDELVVDDRLVYGLLRLKPQAGGFTIDGTLYKKVPVPKPAPAPKALAGLIGEYGWDHDVLFVFEKDGALWALIEWIEFDKLKSLGHDEFAFPDGSLYEGEKLKFTRDKQGRATNARAGSVDFKRRMVGPEEGGGQLRVQAVSPVPELIKKAKQETPPKEEGEFLPTDLVELTKLDKSIHLDIRYAGTNNFLGAKFYDQPRAFMQRPAAEALVRANKKLKKLGFGLLIHDAYRPWYVTKVFWDATPDDKKMFVADPKSGSRHNRGCAVDLSMYDLKTGKPVEMVATYDETTDRANADYPGGTDLQRWHRGVLRDAMENEGFAVFELEWWHFDFGDWKKYRIGNQRFEEISK